MQLNRYRKMKTDPESICIVKDKKHQNLKIKNDNISLNKRNLSFSEIINLKKII